MPGYDHVPAHPTRAYDSPWHPSVFYHYPCPGHETHFVSPYWWPIQRNGHTTNKILRFDLGKEILAWL